MPRKPKTISNLVLPDFSRYFFVAAVVAVAILFFWVISPFFTILVYSALIAVIFYPFQKWLCRELKGQKRIAAFFSTILVLLVILVPLTLFIIFLTQEAVDAYDVLETKLTELNITEFKINGLADFPWVGQHIQSWGERLHVESFIAAADANVFAVIRDIGQQVSSFLVSSTTSVVKSLGDTVISFFLLLLTLYYFFKDGDKLVDLFKKVSPLPQEYEDEIFKKLKDTIYGIVVGGFGTSVLQGIAGGIGFAIAGVENVVFWATIIAFASLVPYIGASIIWIPVVIALFIQGHIAWGIFLAIWGIVVISSIDNITRPYLIGTSAKMNPLATFLVVLGGIIVFGLKGIVFGPLILSLTLTTLHIYQLEYKDLLKS